MSNDRLKNLTNMITPLAASIGLELWGVELTGSGRPVLRIFVEPLPGDYEQSEPTVSSEIVEGADLSDDAIPYEGTGVSVDQCAHLSRLMGLTLDVEDPFAAAWTLEVSSPGIDRQFFQLKQLVPYVGREIDLALLDGHPDWPVSGGAAPRKKFHGVLENVADTTFTLLVAEDSRKLEDPERVVIEWETVRRATLVHVFPEPGLPGKGKAAKNAARASEQEEALNIEGADAPRKKAKKQRPAGGGNA